jgi:hypothetical protein
MSKVRLANIERFIGKGMRAAFGRGLQRHKMLREADLACCVYDCIGKFLRWDNDWRLSAHRFEKRIGRYPDLLLLRDKKSEIVIEVKWRRPEISKKDRKTLGACLQKLEVRKVYFITNAIERTEYQKLGWKKKSDEK